MLPGQPYPRIYPYNLHRFIINILFAYDILLLLFYKYFIYSVNPHELNRKNLILDRERDVAPW